MKDPPFAVFIRGPRGASKNFPTALLLKSPHVSHQALDVFVRQIFGRPHHGFAVFVLEPFFDGFERGFIRQRGLNARRRCSPWRRAVWPMLVWPLPSAPWHLAHRVSQFPLASEAEAVSAAVKPRTTANMMIFFIVVAPFRWCASAHLQGITSVKRLETTTPVLANAALFLRCPIEQTGQSPARGATTPGVCLLSVCGRRRQLEIYFASFAPGT